MNSRKFFIGKKKQQNTEKFHHVTLKSPWKCHLAPQFWKLPDYVDSSRRDRDRIFIPQIVGLVVGPLCQLSKKRVTFSLNSPSQKGHKLAELPGSTDFLFKENKWLEITKHPSIRHSKKLVLKSSRDLSLSLPKGNCSFLITLSVEILNSIKKKSQRLPGHSAGYFGEPPKLPTNKIQSKVWFFTVDFFLSKKWLQLFSVLFFDDVSNTWGGLLQPGQVVFQWISQRILPGGS